MRGHVARRSECRLRRRAERDLQRLDDRILEDIGIARSEIGVVVRHGRRI